MDLNVGTVYWYENNFRYQKKFITPDIKEIEQFAFGHRMGDRLAGYKIVNTEGIVKEWWDRKARSTWAQLPKHQVDLSHEYDKKKLTK